MAGESYSCALRTNGTGVCWGSGPYSGQHIPSTSTFTQLSGVFATCGLRTVGTVQCWGGDGSGQALPPAGSFAQMSLGVYHGCALTSAYAFSCWGANTFNTKNLPAGPYALVSAGSLTTCALGPDQTIACAGWGYPSSGGSFVTPTGTFRTVSAGDHHSCGIKTDGSILCWGQNFSGEVGGSPTPVFTTQARAGSYVDVVAAHANTCALSDAGTISCWGSNDSGRSTPPAGTFVQIAITSTHGCAIKSDGTIVCWGSNNRGERDVPAEFTNAPPVAQVGGPYVGQEGIAVALELSGSDPNGDALSYSWDLGDGTTGSGTAPPSSHTYRDDGTYTISLTVTDPSGASDQRSTTATIDNLAPVLSEILAPVDPLSLGTSLNVSATFTDPGTVDTHSARIEWGDGTTTDLTLGSAASPLNAAHTYGSTGVYRISLTVDDKDGGTDEAAYEFVVIYDPGAGHVTGGGWIDSPSGACKLTDVCESATGKANFGFNSRYRPGANQPDGSTEFQFKAGGLSFHSQTYEWLVVAGARAQFKGTGAINGAGSYGFLITAIDGAVNGGGGVDRFRIKIWETSTGNVLYDNQGGQPNDSGAATALGGGSIVIHR
jgi:hypothetical protein